MPGMGHQIIKQPDGRFCVFSTMVDSIVYTDATAEELADLYAVEAAEKARIETRRITDAVRDGRARSIYGQFAMTYDEALTEHRNHNGRDLD